MPDSNSTPYIALGGEEVLSKLVNTFYFHVSNHTLLSDLFPDDLTETAYKQKQFLTQFLGGLLYILKSLVIRCLELDIFHSP